jgi:transposase-like protein
VAAATARGAIPRERLAELVAQHLTVRAIAARVDRSPTTVRYWLKRYGLETTATARRMEPKTVDRRSLVCPRHGTTIHVLRSDGHWRCARCAAEAVTRRRQRAKRVLVEEAGGCCRLCGYDRCIAALHFHHIDPDTKRFGLGSRGLARAIEELRAEAAKCVLLCANCHAEVESGLCRLVA